MKHTKKIIALALITVLLFTSGVACKRDNTIDPSTTTPLSQDEQDDISTKNEYEIITVTNSRLGVSAKVKLPVLGGIQSLLDKEDIESTEREITIASAENKEVNATVSLFLSSVSEEQKDKTFAGKRLAMEFEAQPLTINGCEACYYNEDEAFERIAEYFIYTTKDGELIELAIRVYTDMNKFDSEITDVEWQSICDAITSNTTLTS